MDVPQFDHPPLRVTEAAPPTGRAWRAVPGPDPARRSPAPGRRIGVPLSPDDAPRCWPRSSAATRSTASRATHNPEGFRAHGGTPRWSRPPTRRDLGPFARRTPTRGGNRAGKDRESVPDSPVLPLSGPARHWFPGSPSLPIRVTAGAGEKLRREKRIKNSEHRIRMPVGMRFGKTRSLKGREAYPIQGGLLKYG